MGSHGVPDGEGAAFLDPQCGKRFPNGWYARSRRPGWYRCAATGWYARSLGSGTPALSPSRRLAPESALRFAGPPTRLCLLI